MKNVRLGISFVVILTLCHMLVSRAATAQNTGWSPPFMVSANDEIAWFPDITTDAAGNVYLVWGSGARDRWDPTNPIDLLGYRQFVNGVWSPPNFILHTADGGYTVRNSIVVGPDGRLYLFVRTGTNLTSYSARLEQAWSAQAWSNPVILDEGYYVAIATDSKGVLHSFAGGTNMVQYGEPGNCPYCSELFYRRSTDGGLNWSLRDNLSNEEMGDERQEVKIDQMDRIHVVWDNGMDWLQNWRVANAGRYRRSDDGGQTWQPTVSLGTDDEPTMQAGLALTNEGNPLVVYRGAKSQKVYFQYSPDGGTTWSAPTIIDSVLARDPGDPPLDLYSLTTDSADHIHLVMVGFVPDRVSKIPQLLHLSWDGAAWSAPTVISMDSLYPEWPKIVVGNGNRLHVTWFSREQLFTDGPRKIWYSTKTVDAPLIEAPTASPTPLPTLTPQPAPPQPTVVQRATSVVTQRRSFKNSESTPMINYVTGDPLFAGIFALVPTLCMIILTYVIVARRRRQ